MSQWSYLDNFTPSWSRQKTAQQRAAVTQQIERLGLGDIFSVRPAQPQATMENPAAAAAKEFLPVPGSSALLYQPNKGVTPAAPPVAQQGTATQPQYNPQAHPESPSWAAAKSVGGNVMQAAGEVMEPAAASFQWMLGKAAGDEGAVRAAEGRTAGSTPSQDYAMQQIVENLTPEEQYDPLRAASRGMRAGAHAGTLVPGYAEALQGGRNAGKLARQFEQHMDLRSPAAEGVNYSGMPGKKPMSRAEREAANLAKLKAEREALLAREQADVERLYNADPELTADLPPEKAPVEDPREAKLRDLMEQVSSAENQAKLAAESKRGPKPKEAELKKQLSIKQAIKELENRGFTFVERKPRSPSGTFLDHQGNRIYGDIRDLAEEVVSKDVRKPAAPVDELEAYRKPKMEQASEKRPFADIDPTPPEQLEAERQAFLADLEKQRTQKVNPLGKFLQNEPPAELQDVVKPLEPPVAKIKKQFKAKQQKTREQEIADLEEKIADWKSRQYLDTDKGTTTKSGRFVNFKERNERHRAFKVSQMEAELAKLKGEAPKPYQAIEAPEDVSLGPTRYEEPQGVPDEVRMQGPEVQSEAPGGGPGPEAAPAAQAGPQEVKSFDQMVEEGKGLLEPKVVEEPPEDLVAQPPAGGAGNQPPAGGGQPPQPPKKPVGPKPVGEYAPNARPEVPMMGSEKKGFRAAMKNFFGGILSPNSLLESATRQRGTAKGAKAAGEFKQRILDVNTEGSRLRDKWIGDLETTQAKIPDDVTKRLVHMKEGKGGRYRVTAWQADMQGIEKLPKDLQPSVQHIRDFVKDSGQAQSKAGLAKRVMVEKPPEIPEEMFDADPEVLEEFVKKNTKFVAAPERFRPSNIPHRVSNQRLMNTLQKDPHGPVAKSFWESVFDINIQHDARFNPSLLPDDVRPRGDELKKAMRQGRARLRAKIEAAKGDIETSKATAAEGRSAMEFERDFYYWPDQFLHEGQWHDATAWRLTPGGRNQPSYLREAPSRIGHRIAMDKAFGQDLGTLDRELTNAYHAANPDVPQLRPEGGNVYNDYLEVFQKEGMQSEPFDRVIAAMEHRPQTYKGANVGFFGNVIDRPYIPVTSNAKQVQSAAENAEELWKFGAHRLTGVGTTIGNFVQNLQMGTGITTGTGRSMMQLLKDSARALGGESESLVARNLMPNAMVKGFGDVEAASDSFVRTGSMEKIRTFLDKWTFRNRSQKFNLKGAKFAGEAEFDALAKQAAEGTIGKNQEALTRTYGLPDSWTQRLTELDKLPKDSPEYVISRTELLNDFVAAKVRQQSLVGQSPIFKKRSQLGAYGEHWMAFMGPTIQSFARWQEAVQQLHRSGYKSLDAWKRVAAKASGATTGAIGFVMAKEASQYAYNKMRGQKDNEIVQRAIANAFAQLGLVGPASDMFSFTGHGTIGDRLLSFATPAPAESFARVVDGLTPSGRIDYVEKVMTRVLVPFLVGKDVAGAATTAAAAIKFAADKMRAESPKEQEKPKEKPKPVRSPKLPRPMSMPTIKLDSFPKLDDDFPALDDGFPALDKEDADFPVLAR